MKIFHEIKNFSEDVVVSAFGEFGKSFLRFCSNIDLNHFGISDIPIDEKLSNKLCEILVLVEFAIKNNLFDAIQDINKFFEKTVVQINKIENKFIRLIKDKNLRENYRNNKKICEIGLINFYNKARVIWENSPEDFNLYLRYSYEFNEKIKEAEIKAQRYKDLECEELYGNIMLSIENIKKTMNDMYCGYHRISLINASIILSKVNRFSLVKKEEGLFGQKYLISIKKEIYKPKVYPIRYLIPIMTDQMGCLFEELEKTPMFDYYMVLVPSTNTSNEEKDLFDIKSKNTIPILLGEKDGGCYFVSYWI